jgi:tRNA-2-methylthio-N6-dimethylallyladenosine synthase
MSDSERISSLLEKTGYTKASQVKEADLIILNMCSVRQSAVDRVYGLIPQLRRSKAKIIATGCILEEDRIKLRERVDLLIDKKDIPRIFSKNTAFLKIVPNYSSTIQAFVPISEGCSNFCTYCAVPYTRGKLISRNYKDIIKEIKSLVKNNFKEIWLLGENVNDYIYKGLGFSDLIKEIDKIEGNFWVRFTSPNPKDFSKKTIESFSKSLKFAPYINLPLQSGDDSILKKMNRPYTGKKYLKLVKEIRESFKKNREGLEGEISISTDIIVGFPGETNSQFINTRNIFSKVFFEMAYISQYSPRPQSLSFKEMPDDVTKKEKKEREYILNEILKKTALKQNKKFLNKEVDVLVLEKNNNYYDGRTRHNKAVRFKSDKDLLGKFVKVKVNKVTSWNFEGNLIKPKLVVISGPTASGKTDLGIALATKFNGEIISADSRLIYKGMDIGTAKPKNIKGIPHHMIDIIDPDEDFNAALFKEKAIEAIDSIIERGKQPFLVGGTGLYIKAIVDNLNFPKIKTDQKLREDLEKKNLEEIFLIYKNIDEEGSKIIDTKNKRRLIRAIEVSLALNESFFKERKGEELYDVTHLGIKTNSEELKKRIEKRVNKMMKDGLEKEVKKLYKKYSPEIPSLKTIGYQEWRDYFDKKITIEELKERIVLNTVKFSKRQITWFKKDKKIKWI